MKIKNYIVENYQLFMGFLESELCKNGISYVRTDNEIHFLDYIIRFFDFEIDKREIIAWGFSKIEILDIEDKFSLSSFSFDDSRDFVPLVVSYDKKVKDYQPRNKLSYKRESNLVNQKLKKYSR